jgi:hypothetical protein
MKNTNITTTRTANAGRISALLLATIGMLFFVSSTVRAQEESMPPSFTSGPYQFNFGLNAGYRNVDITGQNGSSTTWAEERYYEALNLRSGLTVNTFSLYGERMRDASGNPVQSGLFDELYLNADGIGDPFTNASLRMRQFGSYDLQIDFHNAKYFLDRNDSLYTGLHKFDDTRHFLNGSLTVNATSNLDVKIGVNSTGHTGTMTTTGSPYFEFDANANDGTISRGDFYWLSTPVNDQTNDYFAQALLKMSSTSVTVGAGYRVYTQSINYSPDSSLTSLTYEPSAGVPNFSGIVGNTLVNAPLIGYVWNENRNGKTPYVYGNVVTKPVDGLSITGDVRYEQNTLDITNNGLIGGVITEGAKAKTFPTGAMQNYSDTSSGSTTNILKTLNASLTVAGNVMDNLTVTALWRYTHLNENNSGLISEGMDTESYTGSGASKWASQYSVANQATTLTTSVPKNLLEGFINYMPINMLNLRAGINYSVMTPTYNETIAGDSASGAVTSANMSEKIAEVEPFFNFYYKPMKDWKFDGRYSHTTTTAYAGGTTYGSASNLTVGTSQVDLPIRRDPESLDKYAISVDNELTHNLHWSLSYKATQGSTTYMDMATTVINPVMHDNMQSIGGTLNYRFDKTTSAFFSYEYRKSDMNTPTTFTRGNAIPIPNRAGLYSDSMTISTDQHTIDRTLDFTLASKPIDALHISAGIMYLRSTGGADMTQYIENSAPDVTKVGGPYTWIQAHAMVGYDIMKNVGIQVNYQYVSLKEDIVDSYVGLNNFVGSLIQGSIYFRF